MANAFITTNERGANALTENGALSYATSGKALLDQFAHAGTARGRSLDEVWVEQSTLWAENPTMALRFPFYLRMITRQTQVGDGQTEKVQRGQGARDEAFKRLLWIAKFHPEVFYKNLWLLPVVGSWKDLWVLLSMDETLDRTQFFAVMAEGIRNDSTRELVMKYLPQIRSTQKCKTPWAKATNADAKAFAKFLGWTYEQYREFKSTGKAHEFQRVICDKQYDKLKWNEIPGKALLGLVSGKFLSKHDLTKSYLEWLEKQPVAKFNGYVYELGMKLGDSYVVPSLVKKMTIDKQFDNLIQTAKKDDGGIKGNVLCALDTSGSMACPIMGGPKGLTSYDVCVSLGIYFSELNTGAFHNHVAMFDSTSRMKELKGTFTDKWFQIRRSTVAWGSTNFMSLINLIVDTRKSHPEIPLEDFPQTLIVVSDMQFDPSNGYVSRSKETNYETAMRKLRAEFPDKWVENFKIIWWYCAGRPGASQDVPATMDMGGQYLFSGFDGSIVSLLLGSDSVIDEATGEVKKPSMEEMVTTALSQEVLLLLRD